MGNKLLLPAGLYALIDDSVRPDRPLLEVATAAMAGGARVLQLRLEQTADRPALQLIRAVVAVADARGARVIVNDRADLALLGGAHGVHLGDDDLPVAEARRLLGPDALIGATTRCAADIVRAQAEGADHVGLGPVFDSRTKPLKVSKLGLDGLRQIAATSPLPIVAISGIGLSTIGGVAKAGAHAAAVAGALLEADDVEARAAALVAAFFGR